MNKIELRNFIKNDKKIINDNLLEIENLVKEGKVDKIQALVDEIKLAQEGIESLEKQLAEKINFTRSIATVNLLDAYIRNEIDYNAAYDLYEPADAKKYEERNKQIQFLLRATNISITTLTDIDNDVMRYVNEGCYTSFKIVEMIKEDYFI